MDVLVRIFGYGFLGLAVIGGLLPGIPSAPFAIVGLYLLRKEPWATRLLARLKAAWAKKTKKS